MSKDNKKRSSTETARRIWLAGIGAYGRAFTEAQEAIKDVTGKSSEVFDELVQKGQMFEAMGKAKGKEIREKAKMPELDLPEFDLDERINAMRDRLKRGVAAPVEAATEDRLDALEAKLDKILALLEKQGKKPATRTRTSRAKKTAAKKPARKKTTTTKKTPKK